MTSQTPTLKPLETEFRYDGFDFHQVRRLGLVALYAKSKPGWSQDIYEIVVIQQLKAVTFPNGRSLPAREAMPTSELWGVAGWTCTNLERAKSKFSEVVTDRQNGVSCPDV